MTTVRIYDYRNDGILAVDLRHLIDLLAPQSLQAIWTVSPVKLFYPALDSSLDEFSATGQGAEQLEVLAGDRTPVSGTVLAELAEATVQVIWGEFAAVLPRHDSIWVTIRAIDSTFYEVTSTDADVLNKIRTTYKDVRAAADPAASTPIP
jgi:hypothetical protein